MEAIPDRVGSFSSIFRDGLHLIRFPRPIRYLNF